MEETSYGGLLFAGMAFAILAVISFALHYFVALKSPPTQRAAWTAGIAYLITTVIFVFGGVGGYELWAPLAALPGALIAFWYWRGDFRRDWFENPDDMPEGAELAEDDWRAGLIRLVGIIVIATIVALAKQATRGY